MGLKKFAQKLDYIKTVKGHEVDYVGKREPLTIFHGGHELSDLSN